MQTEASFRFNHTRTHCNLKYEMKEQNVIENKLVVRQHSSPKLLQALFFVSNILPGVLFFCVFFFQNDDFRQNMYFLRQVSKGALIFTHSFRLQCFKMQAHDLFYSYHLLSMRQQDCFMS